MPFYEYRCDTCHHQLEALQKISDSPLVTCPECGEDALRKLVSASAFVLKGTGWYATDFRDKPKPQAEKHDGAKGNGKPAAEGAGKSGKSGEKSTVKSGDDSSKSDTQSARKAANE